MTIPKQTKRFILLLFIALLLDITLSPLRAINFMVSSIVAFAAFFLLVWLFSRRWTDVKPWKILLAVFLGWAPINLGIRTFYFHDTLVSLPDALMHVLGMVAGYLFCIAGRRWRWTVAVCSVALCAAIYPAYDAWLHYLNFGTVSGRVEPVAVSPLRVVNAEGEEFGIGGDGTVYVLDFWNISCGICVREFPEFEKFAGEYADRKGFEFLAAGLRSNGESNEEMFDAFTRYYSADFPVVIAQELDFEGNVLGIEVVPTVIVIDGAGRMVYRGNVNGARKILSEWR